MDFPLIPAKSSPFHFREKNDFLPHPSPGPSSVQPPNSPPNPLIKDLSSNGKASFVDAEFWEIADQADLPNLPYHPDIRLRKVFNHYYTAAYKKPRVQPKVDLYI